MTLRFKVQSSLAAILMASLSVLLVPTAQAQDDDNNVPWTDLMVNLPEADAADAHLGDADMDAFAVNYLQQTRLNPPTVQPHAQTQDYAQPQPVIKATHSEPRKLDFSEVVLSRSAWLSDMNHQADLALAANNWPLAELRLAQALGEYQDAHVTRLRLAALLYGRGALGQTRTVLQQGIELAPLNADFRLTLARLLVEQQRFAAALQQLNQVSPSLAEHLDYYSLKAEVSRRSGNCDQAVNTYRELLTHARVGAWWLGLGLCQRQLGQDFTPAFLQARASADLGEASHRFVESQLEQLQQREQHGQAQTY
ncbi:tetratricopeptide repeat protein [Oceanisphaera sp. IT1-181]|uniref:tetratricopeptide repeat protein n=1 Tax=Oceanisphaera sp. IT1-181 TaxID=3081199 RepID=UPI0029C9BD4C|nr:tetratricopeptide repeat protein [Oceanisphaera sp. IT1-181]